MSNLFIGPKASQIQERFKSGFALASGSIRGKRPEMIPALSAVMRHNLPSKRTRSNERSKSKKAIPAYSGDRAKPPPLLAWGSWGTVSMNNIARQKLISELEHLIMNKPVMGTLYITIAQTNDMLVVTLEKGAFSLAYPHTGRLDFVRPHRFAGFCRERGFAVTKHWWGNLRVSCAPIGITADIAAQTIAECFSKVYGAAGPFGLRLRGMGWQSSNELDSQ